MNKYGMFLIIPFSRTMMLTCPFLASDSFLSSSGSHSHFLYITTAKAPNKSEERGNTDMSAHMYENAKRQNIHKNPKKTVVTFFEKGSFAPSRGTAATKERFLTRENISALRIFFSVPLTLALRSVLGALYVRSPCDLLHLKRDIIE